MADDREIPQDRFFILEDIIEAQKQYAKKGEKEPEYGPPDQGDHEDEQEGKKRPVIKTFSSEGYAHGWNLSASFPALEGIP
jgi:hypothetical protein